MTQPVTLSTGSGAVSPLGDREFCALVGECAALLYRTALRLTHHREDAEDLVQEAFTRAWRSRATFRSGSNARAWLLKTMLNARAEAYRHARKTSPVIEALDSADGFYLYKRLRKAHLSGESGDPADAVLNGLLSGEVETALREVPESFRTVFLLVDLEGFSYSETSHILGIPLGTVMSRLSRGRHLLQKALWDYCLRTGICRVPARAPWPQPQLPECVEACRHIARLLDRELDTTTAAQVRAHLAICRRCCDRMAFEQRLREAVRTLRPDHRVPGLVRARIARARRLVAQALWDYCVGTGVCRVVAPVATALGAACVVVGICVAVCPGWWCRG